jgi:hypothetical protein
MFLLIIYELKGFVFMVADNDQRQSILLEAAAVKFVNRKNYLQKSCEEEGAVPRDDVIISLLADLQQEQDKESEIAIGTMQDKVCVDQSFI